MRTYLIDESNNEIIFDLSKTIIHSSELVEFEYAMLIENKLQNVTRIFVRKLARQYFVSKDNKSWKKLAKQDLPGIMLNIDKVYKLYRGYKPSSLSEDGAGDLVTQMPGKIVKILVKENDHVEKGDTLLILEAMKMENEIKSSMTGIVKAIHVKEGQTLEQGILMLEIEGGEHE